jgi:hypothetical protein
MKKKYTIILIVIFLAIIILAVVSYLQEKKKSDQQAETTNENQANISLPPPQGIDKAEFSANSQSNLSDQVGSFLDKQIDSSPLPSGLNELRDIKFKDSAGNPLSLVDFEQAVGIKIDGQLEKFLKNDDYNFIVCPETNGKKSYGLVLNIRLLTKGEVYPDVNTLLASWEPSMLGNLKNLLYRDIDFSDSDLSININFRDGKYRFAEITLENGNKINLNYTWVDDYVLFATSLECTDEIYNYVYGAG